MTLQRRYRFIASQLCGMFIGLIGLLLLDVFTLNLFFTVSFIVFLVLVQYDLPVNTTLRWQRRLTWIVVVGLTVSGLLLIRELLAMLPPGLV